MTAGLPRHLAIIMDGNGRWAERLGRPRIFGHIRGSSRVRELIREVDRLGIPALTLYAFSSENWARPQDEVSTLMRLLLKWLVREQKEMMRKNIRFRAIGEIEKLPVNVREVVLQTMEMSKKNTGLQFSLALSYGSRDEIMRAVKKIAVRVSAGELKVDAIEASDFERELYACELGDPDLLIRTSGEQRISNFMLWQLAYTEFYFTEVMWPDFSKKELHRAFESYAGRERRFGNVNTPRSIATEATYEFQS